MWVVFFMTRVNDVRLHLGLQVPTASVTIEGASALNRVRWSSGGKEVAVGDSEGRVFIYDTGEVRTTITYWSLRTGLLRVLVPVLAVVTEAVLDRSCTVGLLPLCGKTVCN